MAALVVVLAAVSLLVGRFPIRPAEALALLATQVAPGLIEPTWTNQQASIFFNVRLPRIVLALLIGCCLASAGAAF